MMFIVWTVGIGTLAYSVYYFKTRKKINKSTKSTFSFTFIFFIERESDYETDCTI